MISTEARIAIEAGWSSRAKAQGLKPRSMSYRRSEADYFAGAIATINSLDDTPRDGDELSKKVPVSWVIDILTGNPVVKEAA